MNSEFDGCWSELDCEAMKEVKQWLRKFENSPLSAAEYSVRRIN